MITKQTSMKTFGALLMVLICVGPGPQLSAQSEEEGYQLWLKYQCDICHYNQGHGKASATSNPLAGTLLPFEAFSALTRYPGNRMLPYSEKELSNEDLRAIWEYVRRQAPSPKLEDIPILVEWLEALE